MVELARRSLQRQVPAHAADRGNELARVAREIARDPRTRPRVRPVTAAAGRAEDRQALQAYRDAPTTRLPPKTELVAALALRGQPGPTRKERIAAGKSIVAAAPKTRARVRRNPDLQVAGINLDRALRGGASKFATAPLLKDAANLANAALIQTPRAYVEGLPPGGKRSPLRGDVQFAKDVVAGAIKAPLAVAHGQGGEIVGEAGRAYERRYKPALQGNMARYRNVVQREGGLPTALDVAPIAATVLKAGGAVAKAGAAGARAERYVTRPRAVKRTSPGAVKNQRDETLKIAPNPLRVAGQRRRDARRERRFEARDRTALKRMRDENVLGEGVQGARRLIRPEKPRVSKGDLGRQKVRLARSVAQVGGRVVYDQRGRVESVTVPNTQATRVGKSLPEFAPRVGARGTTFYAPREVVGRSRIKERVEGHRDPARVKGRKLVEIRQLGGEARAEFDAITKPLGRHEKAALFYATTGLTALDDPARAVAHLERRERQIHANRQGTGKEGRRAAEADELRKIAHLKANAERAFTPALRQAVEAAPSPHRQARRPQPRPEYRGGAECPLRAAGRVPGCAAWRGSDQRRARCRGRRGPPAPHRRPYGSDRA